MVQTIEGAIAQVEQVWTLVRICESTLPPAKGRANPGVFGHPSTSSTKKGKGPGSEGPSSRGETRTPRRRRRRGGGTGPNLRPATGSSAPRLYRAAQRAAAPSPCFCLCCCCCCGFGDDASAAWSDESAAVVQQESVSVVQRESVSVVQRESVSVVQQESASFVEQQRVDVAVEQQRVDADVAVDSARVVAVSEAASSAREEPPRAVEGRGSGEEASPLRPTQPFVAKVEEPAPADSLWTTRRDGAVKLRLTDSGPGALPPTTVPTLLHQTAHNIPNAIALSVKRKGFWVNWSYREYLEDVRKAAKSFIKLGLEPYRAVGIMGFNSPEWFIADLGCIFAGGLATGIYTTNSPEACQHVASSSQANVVVVENRDQLRKILKVRDQLPNLKAIVQYTGSVDAEAGDNVYTWEQFMQVGSDVPDSVLEERINALKPNKCCMLIYTSGTTGNPKGVMLSHDNIAWTVRQLRGETERHLALKYGDLSLVSYLPLSHIAAQITDLYMPMTLGATTFFAQPDALKGSLVDTLKEIRPHVIMGVPRVWEKFQERMQTAALSLSGMKRRIGRWARGVGLKGNYALLNGQSPPFTMGLAEKLLFKKVRTGLGMDRCLMRVSGAAPITKDTLEYFMSLNQPLCEVYGMSECTGPHTTGFPRVNRVGSVGKELPGMRTVLDKPDEDGSGEIVMHGRHVFMGYLDEEEKTKEVMDEDGGLHTGDLGKKDKDGFLFITGRIKELIITAGGENIPPVPIEDAVKEMLPVVSQCMVIGDKRKFLSMLITLRVEVDPDTLAPTDKLTAVAQEWVKAVGSTATTVSAVTEGVGDRAVLQALQRGIDRVNARAVSNAQRVQKWSLLSRDFSIPGGELGPTMKMKRPVIHKMYSKTIDTFYEDKASPVDPPPHSPVAVAAPVVAAAPPAAAVAAASSSSSAAAAPAVDATEAAVASLASNGDAPAPALAAAGGTEAATNSAAVEQA
ncbi:long-chain-fatty-acid--CoA ligase ACSBG2-like [Babylonia areolata]|uniref:long-chain-fatty-acid--CoA ligase ACSBG2-like n=1 Tax=Babylonia areolata TaxID=304850 RepID=UPI003FCF291E